MTREGASLNRIKMEEKDTEPIAMTSARRGDSIVRECQLTIKSCRLQSLQRVRVNEMISLFQTFSQWLCECKINTIKVYKGHLLDYEMVRARS